jgi:hypothetical protein
MFLENTQSVIASLWQCMDVNKETERLYTYWWAPCGRNRAVADDRLQRRLSFFGLNFL